MFLALPEDVLEEVETGKEGPKSLERFPAPAAAIATIDPTHLAAVPGLPSSGSFWNEWQLVVDGSLKDY